MNINSLDSIKKRYQLVPRTLIFIKKKNKYLLIHKKKPESFGFNKINGVGGHIERGEEPFESAFREIAEETGLKVGNLELTAILFIDINTTPGIQVFVFKAEFLDGEIKYSDEGELHWMPLSEIKNNLDVVSDVPDLIRICEAHKKGSKPQIIKYLYNGSGELRIVKQSR
jgi:8-oxo-dGTP diphosphatase